MEIISIHLIKASYEFDLTLDRTPVCLMRENCLREDKISVKVIQVPIQANDDLTGYLIIGDSITSNASTITGFSQVLILSTLLVSLAMLIPVYFASKRLIRPLNRVTDVANALGQGDFSVRANDQTKGEIGDLAASVNELAEKLSKSITSVTTERNRLKEIFDIISEGIVSVNKDLQPDYSNNAILCEDPPQAGIPVHRRSFLPRSLHNPENTPSHLSEPSPLFRKHRPDWSYCS